MTSSANFDDLALFLISGPVIAAVPPGRDPRRVSRHAWLPTCPRVATRWREEASRG